MDNVSELHRRIEFTIDGRAYTTTDYNQPAADLLRLGGLDPAHFELGELGPRLRRAARRSRCLPQPQLFGVSSSVVRDDEPDARSGPSAAARPCQRCGAHRRGGALSTLRGQRAPLRRVRPEAGFAWSDHHRRPRAGQEVHSGVGPPAWAIGRWSGPRDTARSELHAGSGPHHPQARSQHI